MHIVLDFDDTLFPSTFVKENLFITKSLKQGMKKTEEAIITLIRKIKSLGKLVIITNSEDGWVKYALNKYMKDVLEELEGIPIISARTGNERFVLWYWKVKTFQNYFRDVKSSHIISVGDSHLDIEATKMLDDTHVVKTIKLQDKPSLRIVYKQLLWLIHNLEKVCIIPITHDIMIKNGRIPIVL